LQRWKHIEDFNDPQTVQFIPGTRSYDVFNYAVSQINYILGDGGYSYVVGFGTPSPQRVYFLSAWAPTIDYPYRNSNVHPNCNDAFFGNLDANRMIAYGAMVGGPHFDDSYPDDRGDYITGEPTTDYPAMFTGALSKLIEYYNLPPFCGNLNLGWTHRNASFGGWYPRLLKNTTVYCSQEYSLPLTTGVGYGNCRDLYDFTYSVEGWQWITDVRGAQTGVSHTSDGKLKLTWLMGGAVTQAYWFVDVYDGTKGLDLSAFNGFKMNLNLAVSGATVFFAVLNGTGWTFLISPTTYKSAGPSLVDIYFGGMGPLSDVRSLYIYLNPDSYGSGTATVDDITFCTYTTTAAVTSGRIQTGTTRGITSSGGSPITTSQAAPQRGTTGHRVTTSRVGGTTGSTAAGVTTSSSSSSITTSSSGTLQGSGGDSAESSGSIVVFSIGLFISAFLFSF